MQELVIGNYATKCKHGGSGVAPGFSRLHTSFSIQATTKPGTITVMFWFVGTYLTSQSLKKLVGEAVSLP